mmetsp:Transcript_112060/g.322091  ORF Transcript_112060/g.322091 Transcript_112060/m.322091 type:complete len:201 (-) Transcript_112060:214-816(-)
MPGVLGRGRVDHREGARENGAEGGRRLAFGRLDGVACLGAGAGPLGGGWRDHEGEEDSRACRLRRRRVLRHPVLQERPRHARGHHGRREGPPDGRGAGRRPGGRLPLGKVRGLGEAAGRRARHRHPRVRDPRPQLRRPQVRWKGALHPRHQFGLVAQQPRGQPDLHDDAPCQKVDIQRSRAARQRRVLPLQARHARRAGP